MKSSFLKLPEYYFIMLVVFSGYSPPFHLNPVFIGISVILILQIIIKNRISGLAIGILLLIVNLYMLGALLSEFHEFVGSNPNANQLILAGMGIWLANTIMCLTMIFRYSKSGDQGSSGPGLEKCAC
ncbi:MAG TPA: hypothetical protein VLM43_17380 [Desulfobacterales bacterium]|nr:hypothetical protein [Desulfobacterales bacterium]